MRRLPLAILAAAGVLLAGPGLPGPAGFAGSVVSAHAQLLSSSPGSGEVVAAAPPELRLVFSEPLDGRFSSVDMLDGTGRSIAAGVGRPDPADPYALIVPVPALGSDTYTVNWRSLSAADGHTATGFYSFGIGDVTLAGGSRGSGPIGDLHAGHDATTVALEIQARTIADLGFMLAFGLGLIGLLVLRPAGLLGSRLAFGQAIALVAAAVGSLGLAAVSGSGPGLDLLTYLADTRTGVLLLARAGLGLGGALLAVALVRAGRRTAAIGSASVAAGGGLLLVALGGHAAAYESIAPVAAIVGHLVAGSIWIAGLAALAWVALTSGDELGPRLRAVVPRFSALALVAVAILGLTGVYSAWIQTGDLTSVEAPYSLALLVKVIIVGAALTLGLLNYLAGGHDRPWLGGFRVRILVEAGLAVGIVIATANLASGSPPAQERPAEIAAAFNSAAANADIRLAVQPGRPGPNRLWATLPVTPAPGSTVRVSLQRLDIDIGEADVPLKPSGPSGRLFFTDGVVLAPDTRWVVVAVVAGPDDVEAGQARFVLGLDGTTIDSGLATPPVDPGLALAVLAIVAALLALTYVLAGGSIPRVEPRLGRHATIVGGMAGLALGILLIVGGTSP